MKIFLFTEGGKGIGFGHITRCISICQALKEKRAKVKLIVKADSSITRLLSGFDYQVFDWLKARNTAYRLIKEADAVIIDSYLAGKEFYQMASEVSGRPVYIDDYRRMIYPGGMLINGSLYADELDYPKGKGRIYLLGLRYQPLRRAFWNIPKKKVRKDIRSVLLTCGGLQYNNLLYNLLEYLREKFHYTFKVVTDKRRICAKDMAVLMRKVDVCISGGGQTTYELARCGVPTIGVCFAGNQLLNLQGWQKRGFLRYVGWRNEKKIFPKIAATLVALDYKSRLAMSSMGQSSIDGQGAKRIAEDILKWAGV